MLYAVIFMVSVLIEVITKICKHFYVNYFSATKNLVLYILMFKIKIKHVVSKLCNVFTENQLQSVNTVTVTVS